MKKIISVILAVMLIFSAAAFAGAENDKALKFRDDGTFRILQISDTQDDRYPAYDMLNLVELAIKEAQPDLIVFTGDLVEDSRIGDIGIDDQSFKEGVLVEDDHAKTLDNLTVAADNVLSIMEKSGIPFAIAQGNNDHKCGVSNAEWLEIYKKYSNCIIDDESDDPEQGIDYNIEIKGNDGSTVFNIWLMDTNRGGVCNEQIEWYKSEASTLKEQNGGEPVPAILFQHVQIADIGNLYEECKPWDEGAKGKGTKFYRLNRDIASGNNFFVYLPCEAGAEFSAWKEQGDVIGAFFGHQHIEGFSGVVDGIELGFTYGAEMAKTGPYGYRLITLHEDDPENYDNELYTYEGSIKRGNAHFEKQIDETEYSVPANPLVRMLYYIKNTVVSLVFIIISLFG